MRINRVYVSSILTGLVLLASAAVLPAIARQQTPATSIKSIVLPDETLNVPAGAKVVGEIVYSDGSTMKIDEQTNLKSLEFVADGTLKVPQNAEMTGDIVLPDGGMLSIDGGEGLPNSTSGNVAPIDSSDASDRARMVPCSAGYTCIYQHAGYGGRRLQWRDKPQGINLVSYNFNDEMSSYWNRNSVGAVPFDHVGYQGDHVLMSAGSYSSYVGNFNDRASSMWIYAH